MPRQRQTRVANRIREELARIILREIEDPLVRSVTLRDVEVSPDLKHARVFFGVLDPTHDSAEVLKGLRRARKFLQRCVAEQADLRFTPTLEFRHDPTAERAQRIEEILQGLAEAGELTANEPDDSERIETPDEDPEDGDL